MLEHLLLRSKLIGISKKGNKKEKIIGKIVALKNLINLQAQ